MKSKIYSPMKLLLKIIYTKLTIIVFLLVPLVIFTLITSQSSILAGIRSYVVLTGSMEPVIPVGSIVFVRKQPTYQKEDIVAFESGNMTITHRITEMVKISQESTYKTKGDANNTTDSETISQNNIIGKRIYSIPYLGNIVLFLKTIPGFLLLVVIPTLLFIGFEFLSIKHEIEKDIEKKYLAKV